MLAALCHPLPSSLPLRRLAAALSVMTSAALALLSSSASWANTMPAPTSETAPPLTYDLDFRNQSHTRHTVQVRLPDVNGSAPIITVQYRAFEGIVYVGTPADVKQQTLNIYIPEAYFPNARLRGLPPGTQNSGEINGFTADTAPIFLPNQISGYMPAQPGIPGQQRPSQRPGTPAAAKGKASAKNTKTYTEADAMLLALSRGYIVASPGARGRSSPTGKAPAAIVDLKAAVRYLRHNDAHMPGDAQKIISNGTSAGAALSVLLGASSDAPEYDADLQALGAAPGSDALYAVSAYSPISILEHADAAYEWQFNGVNDYQKIPPATQERNVQRRATTSTLTAAQQSLSAQLKPLFAPYINSLQLQDEYGNTLMLNDEGYGSFRDYIEAQLMHSAQEQINAGRELGPRPWLSVRDDNVLDADLQIYAHTVGRQKTPPAFDTLDLSSPENQLFGDAEHDRRHFTAFSRLLSTHENSPIANEAQVRMMNPLHFISARTPAQHWRIRMGTADRDTSLAIPTILALRLRNAGKNVDFALPWDMPHGGDYDLTALLDWMDSITHATAPTPPAPTAE